MTQTFGGQSSSREFAQINAVQQERPRVRFNGQRRDREDDRRDVSQEGRHYRRQDDRRDDKPEGRRDSRDRDTRTPYVWRSFSATARFSLHSRDAD